MSIKCLQNLDPRYFQMIALTSLLGVLALYSDFAPGYEVLAITLLSALFTQFIFSRGVGVDFDWRSPLITVLSLTLLLKTASLWIFVIAAILAISSKFTVRVNGKHIFNPANFAIVMLLLVAPDWVWVSPGQWGSALWLGFLLTSFAGLVLSQARRGDIALFFLGCWAALVFGRSLWLGDPISIPIHAMQSGALLIFAFFMISDPKTTPDHRAGRFVFAAITALIAFGLSYGWQIREGIFYALFITCMITPLIDTIFRKTAYDWALINTR